MPIIAPIAVGVFLLAGYVQTHEVGEPKTTYTTDSQRVTYINNTPSEFEDVISVPKSAPVDIYATYTPLYTLAKEPK